MMSSTLDMMGKILNIATNLSPPFVFMEYNNQYNKWNLTAGVEVRLLESMSRHFNFSYKIMNCNSDWGVLLPHNNSWTGIIGAIVSNESDIGFAGLTVTEERSRYVYFTDPHIITSVSFITPPPKSKAKVTLVVEPFEPIVWVCILVSMFSMLSITEGLIVNKWIQYKRLHIKWGIISALLKQTFCCRTPNIIHLRILMYFWLLSCLVLTASYSGCLLSFMAIPSKLQPIDELTELAAEQRKGQIQVTAIGSSSYYESLKSADYGIHKELGQLLKPVKDKEEGLNVVRNSSKPFAYISTRDHLMYGLLRYGSKAIYLPPPTEDSTVFIDLMAIALSKAFKHHANFNKFISDLKNGGFLDYWRLSENRRLTVKAEQTEPTLSFQTGINRHYYQILHLDQLQSALYMYAFGQTLALLLLVIEVIYKNKYFITNSKLH